MCLLHALCCRESTGAKQQTFAPGPPQGFNPLMAEMQETIKWRWLKQHNGSGHGVSGEALHLHPAVCSNLQTFTGNGVFLAPFSLVASGSAVGSLC